MKEQIVRLAVDFLVNDGQLENFKAIAKAMTAVADAEPATLGYEWFFSPDQTQCRLLEAYVDSGAVLAHFKGRCVTEFVPQIVQHCQVAGFEIYGDPGPEVAEMAGGLGAKIFSYSIGMNR